MKKPYLALVGRPNTGKSTLFNRLAGRRISIVDDTPGVTRDRLIAEAQWLGHSFYVIDTGGIEPESTDPVLVQMRRQASLAIDMADAVILVVDGREGITAADMEVADIIRKSGTKAVLAVNKIDGPSQLGNAYEFYGASLGEPIPISAEHATGIGDVVEKAMQLVGSEPDSAEVQETPKIAVVGKPNAGKSTLVNLLCGEERVIVHEKAGTTRDAIDTEFRYHNQTYTLIDTAGLKKTSRMGGAIGYYASLRAVQAIERSDICLLVIDATAGVTDQDQKIASQILSAQKAMAIVLNKWDLVEKQSQTMHEMERATKKSLYFVDFAPAIFMSAKEGSRVTKLMDAVAMCLANYEKRISTGIVNEAVSMALAMNTPPSKGGRHLKVYYATQVSVKPPRFAFFVNDETLMNKPYERYLEGKLRDAFGFEGAPLDLVFHTRKQSD